MEFRGKLENLFTVRRRQPGPSLPIATSAADSPSSPAVAGWPSRHAQNQTQCNPELAMDLVRASLKGVLGNLGTEPWNKVEASLSLLYKLGELQMRSKKLAGKRASFAFAATSV